VRITGLARPGRIMLAAVGGGIIAAVLAPPAWAHVEVEADKPQAGAHDVTLTFTGEGESTTAGIISERVVLPAGISAADVRLKKAPDGWKLTAGADGFTVAGAALKPGQDARVAVVVAQLPSDSTTLVFKTLETYSDGKISRWIDVPEEGQPEADNPAAVLKVKPAAAPATSAAGPAASSGAPAAELPSSASPLASARQDAGGRSNGPGAGVWIAGASVALAAASLLVVRGRSRRTGS